MNEEELFEYDQYAPDKQQGDEAPIITPTFDIYSPAKAREELLKQSNQLPTFRLCPDYTFSEGLTAIEFGETIGMHLHPWQKEVLRDWLARDARTGRMLCLTCGLTVPRQNGKNEIVTNLELYHIFVLHHKVLHTSHHSKTCQEAFARLYAIIEDNKTLSKLVKSYKNSNNEKSLTLTTGGSIFYTTRTRSVGRGLTGTDLLILDEAQELQAAHLEAITPTLIAPTSGEPAQLIYMGTSPGPKGNGDVFRGLYDRAHSSKPGRMMWHEWSTPALSEEIPALCDDWDWIKRVNPSLDLTSTRQGLETNRTTLDSDGFARECLGWWLPRRGIIPAINPDDWKKLTHPYIKGKRRKICWGIRFSGNGEYYCVAIATKDYRGHGVWDAHVELAEYGKVDGHTIGHLVDAIDRRKKQICEVWFDGMALADALEVQLIDRKISPKVYHRCRTGDVVSATGTFYEAVRAEQVSHIGQPDLNNSVANAEKRLMSSGEWLFGGSMPEPVHAVALAYRAVMTTKRDPSRVQRIL